MTVASHLRDRFVRSQRARPGRDESPLVVIIGAGFGGLGMAIHLKRTGYHHFLILEKAADIGGVWRDNTYPGAACDVPSHLYSYSFEQRFDWSQRYATQPEIHAYLKRCAGKYDIDRHLRLDTEITSAEFDEDTGRWSLFTTAGERIDADILVPACGQLSRPAIPDITGLDSFDGTVFHSSRWNENVPVAGRRVAVIGTGSSALQIVPAIADKARSLTVFQRSAPHLIPRWERDYPTDTRRRLDRFPSLRLFSRFGWWLFYESMVLGITRWRPAAKTAIMGSRAQLAMQIEDTDLRERLRPGTEIGCKRVGISSTYYPAFTRPNVHLVTAPIAAVTERGIRTSAGTDHEVDTIILATGFLATEFLAPIRIRGRDGELLSRHWKDGARAYLGMAVPGFPNMFMVYGPYTNPGAGSAIYMLECQARYIRRAIDALARAPHRTLDVRPDVESRFDAQMRKRMTRSAWVTCRNWYRHASGRVTNNWPGQTFEYRWRTRRLVVADYRITQHRPALDPLDVPRSIDAVTSGGQRIPHRAEQPWYAATGPASRPDEP